MVHMVLDEINDIGQTVGPCVICNDGATAKHFANNGPTEKAKTRNNVELHHDTKATYHNTECAKTTTTTNRHSIKFPKGHATI